MILHYIDSDGGFTAGDTETGLTAYAYPSSANARAALRNPDKIAAAMLLEERPRGEYPAPLHAQFAALDFDRLTVLRAANRSQSGNEGEGRS